MNCQAPYITEVEYGMRDLNRGVKNGHTDRHKRRRWRGVRAGNQYSSSKCRTLEEEERDARVGARSPAEEAEDDEPGLRYFLIATSSCSSSRVFPGLGTCLARSQSINKPWPSSPMRIFPGLMSR